MAQNIGGSGATIITHILRASLINWIQDNPSSSEKITNEKISGYFDLAALLVEVTLASNIYILTREAE